MLMLPFITGCIFISIIIERKHIDSKSYNQNRLNALASHDNKSTLVS